MSTTCIATPLSEYAIIVDPRDNLAVVKKETEPDLELTLAHNRVVKVSAAVRPGHRFAIREIPAGKFVLQYGQPLGTSKGIGEGDQIPHENMSNEVPVIRDLPEDLSTPPPDYLRLEERPTFMGFR